MCPHCRAFITVKDKICPYCNERVGPRAIDLRSPADFLGGLIPHARFNTIIILLANFGLYVVSTLYSMRTGGGGDFGSLDGRTLVDFGAKYGLAIAAGQWWRLVTAGFLHGGLLHILMNSWVLFDLAPQVEEIYGASRMWVIYFLSSVGGFYLSNLWNPYSPSIGASAALCGLIGAMIALGVRHRSPLGDAIRSTYIRWAIYILLFSFVVRSVDMAAHVGGGITGFVIAYLAGTPSYEGAPVEKLWQAAALICLGITGLSFALWYAWFAHIA